MLYRKYTGKGRQLLSNYAHNYGKKSHIQVRGPKSKFVKDTPANRKKKQNTVEHVPNPGHGDIKNN